MPPGLHAALAAKVSEHDEASQCLFLTLAHCGRQITSPALMRKIILEGHRFAGPDLHAHHIVDVLSPAKGEQGGGAKTLETSIELAKKLAPKAAKDCYGSNKVSEVADERWRPDADETLQLVLYEPQQAILRKT